MTFIPSSEDPAARASEIIRRRAHVDNSGRLHQAPLRDEGPAVALRNARIVLADDDVVMREYARLLLAEHGAEVILAADGREAWAAIRSSSPDLVLLDLMMPHMTGIEVIEAIRADERLRTMPVLMLSGQTGEDAKVEGFRAGADDYLTKPYSERELLARVGGQLAMSRMRNEMIERERQLRWEADQLNEIALELTSELDLQSLVQKVTDVGVSLTGARYGAFFYTVFDEWGDSMELYAVSGASREHFDKFGMLRDTELFNPMFRGDGPVRVEDVTRDPRYQKNGPHRGTPDGHVPVRSYLAVPVVSQKREVIGGLFFGHSEAGAFNGRAERLAEGIAAQAAVSIDNARLYERATWEIEERKRAEAALRETEKFRALLASIVESTTDAVISMTLEGEIMSWNAGAEALYGFSAEEAMGRNASMLIPPERRDQESTILERLRLGERIGYFETTRLAKDGRRIEVSLTISPVRDASGRVVGVSKIARDVTARNQMEQALARSEQQLRLVIDALPAMVSYVDRETRYRFFNRELKDWFGFDPETLRERTMADVMGSDVYEIIRPHVERALTGEMVRFEMDMPRRNGEVGTIEVTYAPDVAPDGEVLGFIALLTDITARKRTEREVERLNKDLKARVHELETLQEMMPVGIFVAHDPECKVITANPAGAEILGIPDSAVNLSKTGPDADQLTFRVYQDGKEVAPEELPIQRCARTGQEITGELYDQLLGDGTVKQTQISASPLRDPEGKPRGCIATIVDITANIRAERAVRESEERFRTLAMNAPAAIYIKDLEGVYQMANPLACAALGRKSVAGLSDHDIMPREWANLLREHDLKVIVTGEPLEIEETVSADGVTREFLSAKFPLFSADGHATGVCGVSVDITARKRAERALRQTMERAKLLAGVAEQLLAAKDPLVVVNGLCHNVAAFLECDFFTVRVMEEESGLLRLKAYDGIPEPLIASVEATETRVSVSGGVAQDGRPKVVADVQRTTGPVLAKARELGLEAYACHPLQIAGRIIGTLSFGTRSRTRFTADEIDLMKTVADQVAIAMERLAARQALLDVNATLEERVRERTLELIHQRRQLQRLAAELTTAEQRERKRLASLLHDDLQQLLVSAKMLMGTVHRRRDDLDDLLGTCDRVQQLLVDAIEAARDMSRQLRPPVLYEDGLIPALHWLAGEMERIHGLEIAVTADDAIEPADDDQRAFLFECVRELLLNIVKHAGVSEAFIDAKRASDNSLQLVVRDEGCGFEVQTASSDGQPEGFGLFSIRERLASIGGRIVIQSRPGNGTVTILEAPVLDSALLYDRPMPEPDFIRRRKDEFAAGALETRVMVVDDHTLVREGIAAMIDEDEGFVVVAQASDGAEAIEAVKSMHPEIVLMDLNMPRMNGIEATRIIRRQWPDVIIVGLSVQEDEITAKSVMEAGASVFLSKSSTPEQIVSAMRELISERAERG